MAFNEKFILAKTKAGFEAKLAANEVKDTSIVFIEDTKQIWTKGKYWTMVPAGGHDRQVLTWQADGEAKWEDLSSTFPGMEEMLAYGIEWDITVSDPHATRIGNMSLHKSLPIQSQLKGCIAQKEQVIYWLNEADWRWRQKPVFKTLTLEGAAGAYTITDEIFSTKQYEKAWVKLGDVAVQIASVDTASSTATITSEDEIELGEKNVELGAVLNGYDGTVRVYCPSFYIKSESEGNKRRVWLSTVKMDNTWTYQSEILLDAYRSTVLNTVPANMGYLSTLPANSAISVVNENAYCRGGNNNAAYDKYLNTDKCRVQLGKPRTAIPRSTMRTCSRNAGSEMLSYDQYKNIFYWLYVVEYANFNCQEAFNAALTAEGYRQGGLGAGVTNWDGDNLNRYNGYYPLTQCGYTNEFGNGSAVKTMSTVAGKSNLDAEDGVDVAAKTFSVPRWRGFENPFGDIWTNLDGIIVDADANNHPNNMNYVYTCQDPSKYSDSLTADYELVGEEIHQDGYTKLFDLGDAAHIIPNAMGGNTTLYKCDYHWTGEKNATKRTLLVGGNAYNGSGAGLGRFASADGVSGSTARIGFRSVSSFVSFPE